MWRKLLEERLDQSDFEYDLPGSRIRIWKPSAKLNKTPAVGVFYRDGIEFTRISMPADHPETLVGLNFCRLYFKEGSKYPASESYSELFEAGRTPPILKHLPLTPHISGFIERLNGDRPFLSLVPGLYFENLSRNLHLKFNHGIFTANEIAKHGYVRSILRDHIRMKPASTKVSIDLALILPFTRAPEKAELIDRETRQVLAKEWGCSVSPTKITSDIDFEEWVKSCQNADAVKLAFIALDTKIGERPHSSALQWMQILEEDGVGYSLFNSFSNPAYTRHGNAMHLLTKAGGQHYYVYPSGVPDLINHWCIGLDLGVGAQYKGKVAVMTLTDGKGALRAFWRAIKNSDETLSPEILEEGLQYLIAQAEKIRPRQSFVVIRDGRFPSSESVNFYKQLLPKERSILIEYVKNGNPIMEENLQQPPTATLCTIPDSSDGFLFPAQAPQKGCLTNTVKFFSRVNNLNYSREQIAEMLCSLCLAPKLSYQPSSLPAPIYYADGIASLSYTNLQFAGWKHLPNRTRDFTEAV